MAKIERYDWNTGEKSLTGEHVAYTDYANLEQRFFESNQAIARLEQDNAQLREEIAKLKQPVSDEESRAAGWTSCGQNFEELRRREMNALLAARSQTEGGK
jgi:hypothetical protein